MRGIAGITGNKSPLVGQDAFYEVSSLYPGTVISDYGQVKWKVFRQANGSWVELKGTLKTGKRVSFSFPQKWYGQQLLIEAFLSNPEKKSPPGIVIRPVLGPKKIREIKMRDVNGNPLAQKPKYGQSIQAQIVTENMLGDTLKLSIWERDTMKSTGHDPNGNVRLWSGTVQVTETDGVAKKNILLTPAMMTEANKSYFEGGEHEYYMVVQADNTQSKHSSQTLAVQNEIVLSKTSRNPAQTPAATPAETLSSLWEQAKLNVFNALGINEMPATGQTATTVNQSGPTTNCGQRYCIKVGDKSEVVREINIRLSGFGGNIPTDEFTTRTETTIKNFQKDYMKISPTGKVCGNTLKAIDEFGTKYNYTFSQSACTCGVCTGYGDGSNKGEYTGTTHTEMYHKYEYPGIHRSMFWALKALMFYMEKDGGTYTLNKISSGYRCREDNRKNGRSSTNHMGKALDLHFNKNGNRTREVADIEAIRADFFVKYLGAQYSWPAANKFSLETTAQGANTWVHYDVRSFEATHLEDKYFAKTDAAVKGEPMTAVAVSNNLVQTCQCQGEGNNAAAETPLQTGCFCNTDITEQVLKDLGISAARATKYLEDLNKTFKDYSITTCLRKSHFLAQLIHESASFVYTAETGVADTEYGGFKGRGLIQITGETNYTNYGTYESQDFTSSLENKKKIEELPYSVRSAGWYWTELKSLNENADANDLIYITRIVNGGLNGYDDRLDHIKKAFEKIYNLCKNDTGKTTDFPFADSKAYNDNRGSFAWGLWHDPGLAKTGCTKDRDKAIAGYERFIARVPDTFSETNWYNIKTIAAFADLKYTHAGKQYVKVLDAAKKRLEALKNQ
ncbi:hypothetical protein [Flavobacterium sp.]|uniref:hypothetical protein n=1 Tax=Flavobacterium sp. TaxID=239 RepID=UPI00120C262F|nr:hypothetical protein [Flavobacterium sp.]RZJ70727.1 MAG: hypothetical protein EOO49_12810 [Flavobacterium sp.]